MAGEQLIEKQKAPPLLKVVEGAATLCIPGVGWLTIDQVAHMPAMGKLPKGCNSANPKSWVPIGEYGIQHGTWK